ncbi:methanogenic corrinoid protein MtbC1 [Rhizobium rosettiformans]|uniref:Methanogenic corrinoid protein MtbC1 n=2 Tax=Rhizobium rosettiformans TaxID=1368430 RepID=A0A7W8HNT9_9HYPH|nr:cobalamin-dependent protein [Rhizobium rosettiformans]MBB5275343.1 methanogenic corrinoid protein MtbC1 [Rhizobium rosettiformans]
MAGDKKGGSSGDPPYTDGKPELSKADNKLTSLEQRILESAIRGAVPRLVGASHPDLSTHLHDGEMPPEIDFHLHPELDPKARELPGTDKAIAYRAALTQALIQPDPRAHREIIEELQRSELPMHTLAIQLFSPVAAHLGRLWCNDETDFIQVAIASTRLGMIVNHLSQNRSQTIRDRQKARRVLLARTQGAMHTIGVSIVASCFRDMGWDVDGGADLELNDSLYMRLSNSSYSLLGISVGQIDEVDECASAIRRIQSNRSLSAMKIAVGGPAVMKNPQAFGGIGADMVARSALEVMHLADRMG